MCKENTFDQVKLGSDGSNFSKKGIFYFNTRTAYWLDAFQLNKDFLYVLTSTVHFEGIDTENLGCL